MKHLLRALPVLAVFLAGTLPLSGAAGDDATGSHHLKYSVSDQTVTVVSAVTPYDSDPQLREAFLHWFKRGFEITLAGKPPLMIEWDVTPQAKAGRRGYDFGTDEAARYLKRDKSADQSVQTAPIPPG
jgi:hypothetical protein